MNGAFDGRKTGARVGGDERVGFDVGPRSPLVLREGFLVGEDVAIKQCVDILLIYRYYRAYVKHRNMK